MTIAGKAHRPASLRDALAAGLALVPEDRRTQGVGLPLSIAGNIVLASLERFSRFGFMRPRRAAASAEPFPAGPPPSATARAAPSTTIDTTGYQRLASSPRADAAAPPAAQVSRRPRSLSAAPARSFHQPSGTEPTTFAASTTIALLAWSHGRGAVLPLLFFSVFGGVAGALACDQLLSLQVIRREKSLRAELPVVADLLALAVAAGESPVAGLERVVRVVRGALGDELGAVLADIRTGSAATTAFDALVARTGVASVARFAEGLSVALERGTPIVDVLHAQAADVRDSARRDLIEEGGRREVAMMLPVVFLLLPVTVVFAFFPGYVGLHLS